MAAGVLIPPDRDSANVVDDHSGADAVTRSLRGYLDAGVDEVVLLPVQTDPDGLRRVYDIAAALQTGG
jgi:hypothetical protein